MATLLILLVTTGFGGPLSAGASADEAAAARCAATGRTLVPRCGVLWGMWPKANASGAISGNLPANVASVEVALGRRLDLVSRYKGWGENIYDSWDAGFRDGGHLVLEDLTARRFGTSSYTSWASIAAGAYDDYLTAQALRAKAFTARTYFSFNQEPEQALERGNVAGTAQDFAAAYRHVHDVFVRVGALNVVWVWWVMGWQGHNDVYGTLWPGPGYVDWIAYDPYDFNTCHHTAAKTPKQTLAPWYAWVTAQPWSAGKPLMLAEYGSNGLDQEAWYRGIPAALAALPRIRAAVEFDSKPGACDHRATGSAANLAGFAAASRNPYIHPTP